MSIYITTGKLGDGMKVPALEMALYYKDGGVVFRQTRYPIPQSNHSALALVRRHMEKQV